MQTNLDDLKAIKGGQSFDPEAFEGKKCKIANVETMELSSRYNPRGKQWVLKVVGESVAEIENKEGSKVKIVPSELFNLAEDEDGNFVGFYETGYLQKFINKMKAKGINDLVGKEPILKVREGKDGRRYLGFVY